MQRADLRQAQIVFGQCGGDAMKPGDQPLHSDPALAGAAGEAVEISLRTQA